MKITAMIAVLSLLLSSSAWALEMKTYYPNGKVQTEMTDQGQKTYYEDGQLMTDMPLQNGAPAGVGKSYYQNGTLMREDDYANGSWKQYDDQGHLVAEGKM